MNPNQEQINNTEKTLDTYAQTTGLRFEPQIEAKFLAHYDLQFRSHITISMYIGISIFILSGSLDLILMNERLSEVWAIRYPTFLPLLLMLTVATYPEALKNRQQILASLMVISIGVAIILIIDLTEGSVRQIYFSGLFLTQMAGLTAMRMLFRYALLTTASIALMLGLYLVLKSTETTRIILADLYLFAGMAFFSLMSNYFLERAYRLSYLKQEIIAQKHQILLQTNQQLKELSLKDGLTGVSNRRAFDAALSNEWRRACRQGNSISLLLFDIDYFKRFNDTYGHQSGDDCLRRVAVELALFANRPGDCAARYGGEEFVLLLPEATKEDALKIAEASLTAVEQLNIAHTSSSVAQHVTVSAGLATMSPAPHQESKELLASADKALYRAKNTGRNQCITD